MFDIGFWELLVIFVLALMILGPERLPRAASSVGRWVGRARAMARNLRVQMEQEIASTSEMIRPEPSKKPDSEQPSRKTDESPR